MLHKDAKPRARPSRHPASPGNLRALEARAARFARAFSRLLTDDQEAGAAIADLVAPRARATGH